MAVIGDKWLNFGVKPSLSFMVSEKLQPLIYWVFWVFLLISFASASSAAALKEGVPKEEVQKVVFSGREIMHYAVSWTGGIKIGDLYLELKADAGNRFAIHARVTDFGLFRLFYPVNDDFVTQVQGARKLPYRYEIHQREGRGSATRRLLVYDQSGLRVNYRKNDTEVGIFPVAGPVYNEFSSFYITRTMDLVPGNSFMVPTFADKKRNEVKVLVKGREEVESILGKVRTVVVMPLMKFKGLYDKDGDTVIWFTDDECRIPVRINSKILIGSLTADLVEYSNPACPRFFPPKNNIGRMSWCSCGLYAIQKESIPQPIFTSIFRGWAGAVLGRITLSIPFCMTAFMFCWSMVSATVKRR